MLHYPYFFHNGDVKIRAATVDGLFVNEMGTLLRSILYVCCCLKQQQCSYRCSNI